MKATEEQEFNCPCCGEITWMSESVITTRGVRVCSRCLKDCEEDPFEEQAA